MGQGLGWIGGGFMVGDIKWTFIGALLAALGIGLITRTRRRSV
jgi:MYXO-CTERM domain-containing protein